MSALSFLIKELFQKSYEPEPLPQYKLDEMYVQTGLTFTQIDFIRNFLITCANLYGYFFIKNAWETYKTLSGYMKLPKMRRKDITEFLEIMYWDRVPFSTYMLGDLNMMTRLCFFDLHSKEPDSVCIVIHKDLTQPYSDTDRFFDFRRLMTSAHDKPFVPKPDFFTRAGAPPTAYETKLLSMLETLQCVDPPPQNKTSKNIPCFSHCKGKFLNECSYYSEEEYITLRSLRGELPGTIKQTKQAKKYEAALNSDTAAQHLVDLLKQFWKINSDPDGTDGIAMLFDALKALGVPMTEKLEEDLKKACVDMYRHHISWVYRGLTPEEYEQWLQEQEAKKNEAEN